MANKKFKHETGGLQEKKVKVEPTKEEIKVLQKEEKAKRREKVKEKREKRPNFFVRMYRGFRGMLGELKKVNWPTLSQTMKKTGVVLAVVLIFGLVVFGLDQGIGALYNLLTRGFA